MEVYIITREINEYNQDGAYFEKAYKTFPTIDKLQEDLNIDIKTAKHIIKGGGRKSVEDEWYNLEILQIN